MAGTGCTPAPTRTGQGFFASCEAVGPSRSSSSPSLQTPRRIRGPGPASASGPRVLPLAPPSPPLSEALPPPAQLHGRAPSPAPAAAVAPAATVQADHPTVSSSGDQPSSRQLQSFGLLARSGPQVPVDFEVGGHVVRRQGVLQLDPDAVPFWPSTLTIEPIHPILDVPSDVISEIVAAADSPLQLSPAPPPPPEPCRCHNLPKGSCPDVISDFIDLVVRTRAHPSGLCNMDGARIPLRDPPINPAPWESLLAGYHDRDELVAGLTYGWDLSLLPDPAPHDAPANLPSAYEHADAVDRYVATELLYGSLVGPLPDDLPFDVFRSPLAAVPKPPDGWRTITDCSQRGRGINAWISADIHRGQSAKIQLPGTLQICHAVKSVQLEFPGEVVELFKGDYGRYYRQFINCPTQSPFLAVGWRGDRYADRSWSFGNRGACGGAQRYSSAVAWFFRTRVPPRPGAVNSGISCCCEAPCSCGDNHMYPYVDDSIGIVPRCHAKFLFNAFIDLVGRLGLLLSATPGHITPPAPVVTALGLQYDTINNVVALPQEKLVALDELLAVWLHKATASPKELATLAGKLLWCCNVVPPGRVFLGRVLATKRLADRLDRSVALDTDFRLDIEWWYGKVHLWNGRSFLVPRFTADVALDASSNGWHDGGPGIGGFCFANNEFFSTGVPPALAEWHIGDLELFAHIIALRVWGHGWGGTSVNVLTDNEGCRFLLLNGRTRDPLRLKMARCIVGLQFSGNYRIESARISTSQNVLADALSRAGDPTMLERFTSVCRSSNVRPVRVEIPPDVFDPSSW